MSIKDVNKRIRDAINRRRALVIGGALAVVGLSAAGIAFQLAGGATPRTPDLFYWDLTTGTLFVAQPTELPPIPVPGSAGARAAEAFVFACENCRDDKDRFVGYIELYQAEAKNKITSMVADYVKSGMDATTALLYANEAGETDPVVQEGHVIGIPSAGGANKVTFFAASSAQADEMRARTSSRCKAGQRVKGCLPSDVALHQ